MTAPAPPPKKPPQLTRQHWSLAESLQVVPDYDASYAEDYARWMLAARELLREIEEWRASSEVQGALAMAWVHGQTVSKEFSEAAERMFSAVRALASDAEKEA